MARSHVVCIPLHYNCDLLSYEMHINDFDITLQQKVALLILQLVSIDTVMLMTLLLSMIHTKKSCVNNIHLENDVIKRPSVAPIKPRLLNQAKFFCHILFASGKTNKTVNISKYVGAKTSTFFQASASLCSWLLPNGQNDTCP